MSVTKELQKKIVLTQAQFNARQSAGTLQEGVEYEITDYQEPVQDVQIKGTSILSDGVANIPSAYQSTLGVVRGDSNGFKVALAGGPYADNRTYAQYGTDGVNSFIGKGTLETVLDNETVRVDKATSLTDAQKAQARTNIAAIALEEYDSTATPVDGVLYYVAE